MLPVHYPLNTCASRNAIIEFVLYGQCELVVIPILCGEVRHIRNVVVIKIGAGFGCNHISNFWTCIEKSLEMITAEVDVRKHRDLNVGELLVELK